MLIETIKNKVFSGLKKTPEKQSEDPDRKIIKCDLLPCPFCGGEVKLHRVNANQIRDPYAKNAKDRFVNAPVCFIRCSSCGIASQSIVIEFKLNGTYVTEKAAVKRLEKYWNRTTLCNDGSIKYNEE